MIETIDVFIGGPMGNEDQDGTGLKFSDHLSNLAAAVNQIANEINPTLLKTSRRLNLLNPNEQALGGISDRVFSWIDRAELGIFVLSCHSPSAMYELTLMHALGRPVIPVFFSERVALKLQESGISDARSLSHYLRDEFSILLDSFSVESIKAHLRPKIEMFCGLVPASLNLESNPITRFYGLPLLDVSATTGLATGYFVNFLSHLLKPRDTVFSKSPDLERLVIIKPLRLDDIGDMMTEIRRKATQHGLEVKGVNREGRTVEAKDQVRGELILSRLGPFIFDVPAPLRVQLWSPRYLRVKDEESRAVGSEARAEASERLKRLERAMIGRFFESLRSAASRGDFVSTRLEFLTVDELIERASASSTGD